MTLCLDRRFSPDAFPGEAGVRGRAPGYDQKRFPCIDCEDEHRESFVSDVFPVLGVADVCKETQAVKRTVEYRSARARICRESRFTD